VGEKIEITDLYVMADQFVDYIKGQKRGDEELF